MSKLPVLLSCIALAAAIGALILAFNVNAKIDKFIVDSEQSMADTAAKVESLDAEVIKQSISDTIMEAVDEKLNSEEKVDLKKIKEAIDTIERKLRNISPAALEDPAKDDPEIKDQVSTQDADVVKEPKEPITKQDRDNEEKLREKEQKKD